MSAVLHSAIIAVLVWSGERAMDAMRNPGDGPGKGGGGGGGNRAFAVLLPSRALAAPVPPVVVPEPDALVVPKTVEPIPQDTVPPAPATDAAPSPAPGAAQGTGGTGAGPGTGGGVGSGTGTGVGSGVGPDSGGSGRIYPPQPQGIILPPGGAPSSLRGIRLTVRFDISERGQVLGVEVEPAIRDRGYRNEFMDRMRRYTFAAAHGLDGRPVRAVFQMEMTVSGR